MTALLEIDHLTTRIPTRQGLLTVVDDVSFTLAEGDRFLIVLNGKTLLDAHDSKHASGVIGFQCQINNRIEFRGIKLQRIKK